MKKPTKSQVASLVSGYKPPSDYGTTTYTVADYSVNYREVSSRQLRSWTDQTAFYWEEKGYEILGVKKVDDRFCPYEVTMKHPRLPRLIEFASQYKAEEYARKNFQQLWAAYQESLIENQQHSVKLYLREVGLLPSEIQAIMVQAKDLTGAALDSFISGFSSEIAF